MATDSTTDKIQHVSLTWESDANQFILFDATISEVHAGRSEITSFPVESGSDHTDHIRRLPDELSLVAVVAERELLKGGNTPVAANTGGDVDDRSNSAYSFLVQSKDQGRLVSVFTTLRTYRNMAIKSIDVSRDKDTSRIVQANIQLREVLIAVTEQRDAPKPSKTRAAPGRNKKNNKGRQNTEEASDANKEKAVNTSSGIRDSAAIKLGIGKFLGL